MDQPDTDRDTLIGEHVLGFADSREIFSDVVRGDENVEDSRRSEKRFHRDFARKFVN